MCKCFVAQFMCCCGPWSCGLCCRCLPPIKESTGTRFMYIVFFGLAMVIAGLMQASDINALLVAEIPGFNETCLLFNAGENCQSLGGYTSVYKVCIAVAVFHFVLLLTALCINHSQDCRAAIHNGFWGIKFAVLLGIAFALFYTTVIERTRIIWTFIGMAGGGLFILVQLFALMEFAHAWHSKWYGRSIIEGGSACWKVGIYFFATVLFVISAAGAVFLYFFYAHKHGCEENKVFVFINAGLCILILVISMLPCTRYLNANTSVLQACIVSAYVMYLTWSAFTSEPPVYHNQPLFPFGIHGDDDPDYDQYRNWTFCQPEFFHKTTNAASAYIGVFLILAMAVYAGFRSSQRRSTLRRVTDKPPACSCCTFITDQRDSKRGGQKVIRNESSEVIYSYAFFHFTFMVASFFLMMQLTMWYKPESSEFTHLIRNWPSVWVKMVSSWLCIIIYIVTIFVPKCIPGTDFSYIFTPERIRRPSLDDDEPAPRVRGKKNKGKQNILLSKRTANKV